MSSSPVAEVVPVPTSSMVRSQSYDQNGGNINECIVNVGPFLTSSLVPIGTSDRSGISSGECFKASI